MTNARRAKRCHHIGARNVRKNFTVAGLLQNGDARDEWMFRVIEFYSGARRA
jgi:hypothetical protein